MSSKSTSSKFQYFRKSTTNVKQYFGKPRMTSECEMIKYIVKFTSNVNILDFDIPQKNVVYKELNGLAPEYLSM